MASTRERARQRLLRRGPLRSIPRHRESLIEREHRGERIDFGKESLLSRNPPRFEPGDVVLTRWREPLLILSYDYGETGERPDYRTVNERGVRELIPEESFARRVPGHMTRSIGWWVEPARRRNREILTNWERSRTRTSTSKVTRRRRDSSKPSRRQEQFIGEKIRVLRHEGYPENQAIPIAYRMAGVPPRRDTSSDRRKLEDLLWRGTHRDYKTTIDGRRAVLHLDPRTGASTLVPIDSISHQELIRIVSYKSARGKSRRRDPAARTTRTRGRSAALERFVRGYADAALFASTDDDGEPLDRSYSTRDLAPETRRVMLLDATNFFTRHVRGREATAGREEEAGNDFWLTREGHGAGFWDGDWPEPDASELTRAAKAFGEAYLYVGDDGRIYQGTPSRRRSLRDRRRRR